jgi:hypothetical protein
MELEKPFYNFFLASLLHYADSSKTTERRNEGWQIHDELVRISKETLVANRSTIRTFNWRGRGKPRKASVRTAGMAAEIRTEHFLIQVEKRVTAALTSSVFLFL